MSVYQSHLFEPTPAADIRQALICGIIGVVIWAILGIVSLGLFLLV